MIDEGHTVEVIYLAVANAFDFVSHGFLLEKMKRFGLGNNVVWWVEAHLSGRVSSVHGDKEL